MQLPGSEVCAASSTSTLLVADGSCPFIRQLLAHAETPVLWLQAGEDPLLVVSSALEERRRRGVPVQTLHWVGHGSPGQLNLGSSRINSSTLLANAHLLASWDINRLALWSCHAGADPSFIALIEELTGATVWSTSDALGRLNNGSSHWTLGTKNTNGAATSPSLPVDPSQRLAWPYQLSNRAPSASGSPSLAAVTEDSTSPAGDTVANLFGSSFSDDDSDTFLGVAITANAAISTEGAWEYSTDNGSNWKLLPPLACPTPQLSI